MFATTPALLRASSLLLCFVAGSLQVTIKEFVVPKAVEVGSNAELRCQYKLEANETEAALFVKWWWTPQSASTYDRKLIYQRISGYKPVSTLHDKIDIHGNDSIVLLNLQPLDSGTYECEVSNIEEIRNHETLTVFSMGTGPDINYTLIRSGEENMLLIECEANNVAPLPDMNISFHGKNINISKIVQDPDEDGLYKIYANATVSAENIEDGKIQCELFYTTLERPPYVDIETYVPPGNTGIRFLCSWGLLAFAAAVTCLQLIP